MMIDTASQSMLLFFNWNLLFKIDFLLLKGWIGVAPHKY